MKIRRVVPLLFLSGLLPHLAVAQPQPGLPCPKDLKCPHAAQYGDRLERFLDLLEENPVLRLINPRDGVGLRVGGIAGGSGFALGPAWRTSRPLGGRIEFHASGAISPSRDRAIDAGLAIPELGWHRLAVGLEASSTHLANERFFGVGPTSSLDDRRVFVLDRREVALTSTLRATHHLSVAGGARVARMAATDGAATTFGIVSVSATADYRDVPGNPRRGGRYRVGVERYTDRSLQRSSFNRLRVDVEQHFSWWRHQRLLTLRGMTVLSDADRGHDVPFYLLPTLGGSQLLRGFVTDRFRDRHVIALQAEYAWDIWPFLNAVLFYETGQVGGDWRELISNGFKRDYGVGFRVGSARTIAVRTDVAFGSGEGTRISMRFSHAF